MGNGYHNKKVGGYLWDYVRHAKSCSYGGLRSKSQILGVALHWTEGSRDTAENECDFFATGNDRAAGAHIFIDRQGMSGYSIPIKRTAWSVMSRGYDSGSYDGILDNTNTISIELCGCNDGAGNGLTMSEMQEAELYDVLKWIRRKCPNCKNFVRHYDIRKKPCPKYYVDNTEAWNHLKKYVERVIFKHE